MKRFSVILILSFLVSLVYSLCFAEAVKKPGVVSSIQSTIGRYQIIPVEYVAIGSEGEFTKKAVIKIDTLSGETWVLMDWNLQKIKEKDYLYNIYERTWEKLESRIKYEVDSSGRPTGKGF